MTAEFTDRPPKPRPLRAEAIRFAAASIRTSARDLARKGKRQTPSPEREQLFRHIDMLLAGADAMEADADRLSRAPAGGTVTIRYMVYEPPAPGQPYLAVALMGRRMILMSTAPDRVRAEQRMNQLRARVEARAAGAAKVAK